MDGMDGTHGASSVTVERIVYANYYLLAVYSLRCRSRCAVELIRRVPHTEVPVVLRVVQ